MDAIAVKKALIHGEPLSSQARFTKIYNCTMVILTIKYILKPEIGKLNFHSIY